MYPSNAMYMDPDDKNVYDDECIFLTSSYACGAAMTVSCLDSLVSAVRMYLIHVGTFVPQ